MDITGKKAVVFGGTSGIGLSTTKQLVAKGAEVIAISRDPSKAGDLGPGVTLEACDATDEAQTKDLLARLAPYDILISAATGGGRAIGPFMSMEMSGFQASFAKMWGYANVVRHGAGHVADGGCIV
ncbi:MAG: SDR family NAD(P)-dependent oxidoreductase, partial [Pseudomonadota bacterium]